MPECEEKIKSIPADSKAKPASDEDVACEECGKFGAYQIGDHFLCMDCYQGKGSCCPEFGKDDLWSANNERE